MHPDTRAGLLDSLPVHLSVVPFGLVFGVSAVDAGLSPGLAVGMSVLVFTGTAQIAAVNLLAADAPLSVVVATAVVVNLRLLGYSASLAPHLAGYRRRVRAGLSYLLTDQAYALSIAAYTTGDVCDERRYFFAAGGAIWIVFLASTTVGAVFGTAVPPAWEVSFAVPLVFLALLMPAVRDRPTATAAVCGGGVSLALAGLPMNLGVLAGAGAGTIAGTILAGGDRQ